MLLLNMFLGKSPSFPPNRCRCARAWILCSGLVLLGIGLAFSGVACGSAPDGAGQGAQRSAADAHTPQTPTQADASQTQVDSRITPKPSVEELVTPYREQMDAQMNEVLAWCPDNMRTRKPEGNLGNLIADVVLARAKRESGLPVDACVLNNGGLRMPWSEGPITLGLVFEVMPFDNDLVVLRLSPQQMRSLADEIAARGGEPVAGMEFTIEGERAADLEVAGDPVTQRDYWIATNNYLADGGGGMPTLWEPQERVSLGILIRDAIADAVRAFGTEGRSAGERPGTLPKPKMGRIRD